MAGTNYTAAEATSGPRAYYPNKVPAYCHIPPPVMLDERLRDFDKILYGRLRGYAGKKHFCFVKIETLTKELGKSRRTIYRALECLLTHGYLWKNRAHQRATTNYYFIINDRIEPWLVAQGLI